MYLIISGTNRAENSTHSISDYYESQLKSKGIEVKQFCMLHIPAETIRPDMYENRSPEIQKIQDELVIPADKIILVLPEYNGSIPGIVKLFIDMLDWKSFYGKKTCLVGIASGRAGNLRGLDHMTSILHHLNADVYHNTLKLGSIGDELDDQNQLIHQGTKDRIDKQIDGFINF